MKLPQPYKKWLGTLLLAAWIVVSLLGIASLSLSHVAPMPGTDDETQLAQAMLALRQQSAPHFITHTIYQGCSCTENLFTHLIQRKPFPGTEEVILFVGEDQKKQQLAQQAGFAFKKISA